MLPLDVTQEYRKNCYPKFGPFEIQIDEFLVKFKNSFMIIHKPINLSNGR